jgi:hypothetical protein
MARCTCHTCGKMLGPWQLHQLALTDMAHMFPGSSGSSPTKPVSHKGIKGSPDRQVCTCKCHWLSLLISTSWRRQ